MKSRLSRRARADLDDIWTHVANLSQNTEAATKMIRELDQALQHLGKSPQIGRRRDGDLGRGLRSFATSQHVIVYRVGKWVEIVGICHHTRNLPSLFQ